MARAGMALRRGTNPGNQEGNDDVQRSIELLDRVLSEFDDVENANQIQIGDVTTATAPNSTTSHRQTTAAATSMVMAMTTSSGILQEGTRVASTTTPDDESPSLGHQSEDDGYMSMNGRKARFNLTFRPLNEETVNYQEQTEAAATTTTAMLPPPPTIQPGDPDDFPPPPEEAQRLIATLLPKVSPAKRNGNRNRGFPLTQLPVRIETIPPPKVFQNRDYAPVCVNGVTADPRHTATQTTLPKTRHQRPYGWEHNDYQSHGPPQHHHHQQQSPSSAPGHRFGSLPFQYGGRPVVSPTRVPPRTVPTAIERHREVRRGGIGSEENLSSDADDLPLRPLCELADDERFSDDSLEEMLPPPPPPLPTNKRGSIAWEVPFDDEALLTPGSTKVVGRRRRKSGSLSSTGSMTNGLKELDDWPDPPPCTTEDETASSPFSDCDEPLTLPPGLNATKLNNGGTYVVRRGGKRRSVEQNSSSSLNSRLSSDLSIPHSRHSAEWCGGGNNARQSRELNSPCSRYSLDLTNSRADLCESAASRCSTPRGKSDFRKHSTTFDNIKSLMREGVIETIDAPIEAPEFQAAVSPIVRVLSLPSLNAEDALPRRELAVTVEEEEDNDSQNTTSAEISPLRKIEKNISELLERRDIESVQDAQTAFRMNSNNNNNNNRPSDAYYPKRIQKSESAKEMLISHREKEKVATTAIVPTSISSDFPATYRDFPPLPPSPVEETEDEYAAEVPPVVPPHRDAYNASSTSSSLRTRSMDASYARTTRYPSNERRTLPTELQDARTRRTYQKKSSAAGESQLQTSCSLPETPIFARGCCDVPRTPHRRAPDVPPGGGGANVPHTIGHASSSSTTGAFRRGRSHSGLEQAIAGAELLRLAGGPGRGWYPKHRQRRPASIEHLDRLAPGQNPWDGTRKPQTLPPNLTPKFFQRSPRDALRRVTSLLIRKGNNNGKETKKDKELTSPTIHENANGEEVQKKKGFFKSFWKRSRHYSLEQQQ